MAKVQTNLNQSQKEVLSRIMSVPTNPLAQNRATYKVSELSSNQSLDSSDEDKKNTPDETIRPVPQHTTPVVENGILSNSKNSKSNNSRLLILGMVLSIILIAGYTYFWLHYFALI